jgi:hypothetical protein
LLIPGFLSVVCLGHVGGAYGLAAFFAAFVTDSFQDDALVENSEVLGDVLGIIQIVEISVMEIRDFAALDAMQVVMVRYVRVEPFCAAEYFDDVGNADICKGQKGPVDRIKRDIRVVPFNDLIEGIGRGVHLRLQQLTIDGHALGRDLELMAAACVDEILDFFGGTSLIHDSTK